jgi:aspartate kinase
VSIIVQKYGGTSVGSAERIKAVAKRVAAKKAEGHQVVVVVSAMGKTTDGLIELSRQVSPNPHPREMDILLSTGETVSIALVAMALNDIGEKAMSLTGAQAGIRTDMSYTRARIANIDPSRIHRHLDEGNICIVAGFQGINEEMDVTTLGRGGSDTTAVAVAAALKAEVCEIYTDVEGVYTADPRIVPNARMLPEVDYEEMAELATTGSKVLHPRSVEIGWVFNVPILVASSFVDKPGTMVRTAKGEGMEIRNKVRGISHDLNVAKVTIRGVPDRPGIAGAIFGPLAKASLSVDVIVQNSSEGNLTDLSFTVVRTELAQAMEVIEPVARQIGARGVTSDAKVGKVSVVGTGMANTPGYAARMFETMHKAGINIQMITTSEIRITCIVAESQVADAVRALHNAFELEKAETA